MPQYFFDTSALVKYYHEETGSNRIKALFSSPHFSAKISALGVLEAQSAFAMKARSGKLALIGAELLKARFMLDVSAGLIETFTVTGHHFIEAGRLLDRFGLSYRLRSLDALQLAVADDLRSQRLVDFVVAADSVLLEVGALMGMRVINANAE